MGNENRTVEWDGINSGSVVAHGEERGRGRRGGDTRMEGEIKVKDKGEGGGGGFSVVLAKKVR